MLEEHYNINLTYEQGIINEEVVGLGSSQLLRKLRELVGYTEEQLFISEYVAVSVSQKTHYRYLIKNGFYLNGKHYVRFNCSASNARNSSAFFIREDLYDTMFEILSCGVNPVGKEYVLAKWNAYFSLNASSTLEDKES